MAGSIEFTPPYQDGWQDNEEGATPITADILNNNYDAFLVLLNTWIGNIEEELVAVPDFQISSPSSGQVLKFNGSKWVNAAESGGGSNVSWNQILQSGTQIASITINGTSYTVYAPTPVTNLNGLSDVTLVNPSSNQVLQYNSSISKWENKSISVGDTVSFTQIQSSGVKIGTITIDGTNYDIYAPQGGGGSYEPNGVTYTVVNNATDDTQSGQATRSIVVNKFEDDVQTDTGSLSYATVVTTGPNNFTVGNVKSTYTLVSGTAYWILTVVSGHIQYNGTLYETGDEILRTPVVGSSVITLTDIEEMEESHSTVVWTQTQQSGTKIAEISIDGVSQNVYIPNLPTKTSDLTNDSNFVADASYVHTDNNYTATEKNKLSGLVAVEANPSGTASTDLTKIAIGGTNYNIPSGGGGGSSTFAGLSDVDIDDTTLANGQVPIWDETEEKWKNGNGGGGTTVIANPTGTPTDDLNSIQIGSDIYRIVGGGGGTAKALVMKTMTWTGDGQSSKSITFDKKPLAIFNIWGRGEGSSNVYCLNAPFVYGETNYFISSYSGGIIIPSVTYSNDGLTMTMSGADAGFAFNCANAPYTMWYLVEENVGGSASLKDITGTLTAGQTEITLADPIITTASTFEPFTDKFGVNPTDMELVDGAETVLQPLVTQESELLGTVTVSSTFAEDYVPWKAFTSAGSWVGTGNIDQWLAYEFPTNVIVSKVQWFCDDTSRRGTVTNIQYSNDGTTWNNCTLLKNERGDVEISGANSAKHWRLFFAAPFGSWTEPMIRNLEFIAVVNGVKLTFPVQSENLNVKVRVS